MVSLRRVVWKAALSEFGAPHACHCHCHGWQQIDWCRADSVKFGFHGRRAVLMKATAEAGREFFFVFLSLVYKTHTICARVRAQGAV